MSNGSALDERECMAIDEHIPVIHLEIVWACSEAGYYLESIYLYACMWNKFLVEKNIRTI